MPQTPQPAVFLWNVGATGCLFFAIGLGISDEDEAQSVPKDDALNE